MDVPIPHLKLGFKVSTAAASAPTKGALSLKDAEEFEGMIRDYRASRAAQEKVKMRKNAYEASKKPPKLRIWLYNVRTKEEKKVFDLECYLTICLLIKSDSFMQRR